MSEDEIETELTDTLVKPRYSLLVPEGGAPSMVADQVKVFVDGNTKLCTLVFIRRHPTPEEVDGIIRIGQITDEVFLEVKVPFIAVTELVLYLKNFIKQMNTFEWNEAKFGPIHEKQSDKRNSP